MRPSYYYLVLTCLLFFLCTNLPGQYVWKTSPQPPTPKLERVFNFVVNDILYVGGGRNSSGVNINNVWSYDATKKTWKEQNNFPGIARRNAVAFTIGDFGYMGLGYDGGGVLNDFWKYDPTKDEWEEIAALPVDGLSHATGISGEDKGYIAFGADAANVHSKDLWEYDPVTDTWTLRSELPASERWRAFGFILEGKIYLGGGNILGQQSLQDFWEYDIAADTWTEMASFPSTSSVGCSFFTLNDQCYVLEGTNRVSGTGVFGDQFYRFSPQTNSWILDHKFIGRPRIFSFAASIGEEAFVGLGRNHATGEDFSDLFVYRPGITFATEKFSCEENMNASSEDDFVAFEVEATLIEPTGDERYLLTSSLGQISSDTGLYNQVMTFNWPIENINASPTFYIQDVLQTQLIDSFQIANISACFDLDGDGFPMEDDCNDEDATINPDAIEIPDNGIDEDCDGEDLMTATADLQAANIQLFPNPTDHFLAIDLGNLAAAKIKLSDYSGKILLQQTINGTGRLDLSAFPDGIYALLIEAEGAFMTERIVKLGNR